MDTPRTDPRRYLPAVLLAVAGSLLSVAAFVATRGTTRATLEAEFQRRTGDRAQAIRRALEEQFSAVRAMGAFVSVVGVPERAAFVDFVSPLYRELVGCHALGWVPRVRPEDVGLHERSARADGAPDEYEVWGEDARDGRNELHPVQLLFPLTSNNAEAVGFDLASEPVRREALERARDRGELTITGRVTLVQETEGRHGVLIVYPCYDGPVPGTVAERQERLVGFVTGVVRIADVVDEGLSFLRPGGIDMRLVDASDGGVPRVLHEHASRSDARHAPGARPAFRRATELELGGRTWIIEHSSAAAFEALRSSAPLGLLVVGLCITALTSGYLAARSGHVTRRERLVQEREVARRATAAARAALRESEVGLARTLDSLEEVVWKLDAETLAPLALNSAAEKVLGRPASAFLAEPGLWFEIVHPGDEARLRAVVRRALEHGMASGEYRVVHPSGEVRWVQVRAARRGGVLEGLALDVTTRLRAEDQRRALADELDHRVKNILATVIGLAQQSFADGRSVEAFRATFDGRLRALARTHDALARSHWRGVEMAELVQLTLQASDPARLTLGGQVVLLPAHVSGPLALGLHELATNAIKYGALGGESGHLSVNWTVSERGLVTIEWCEEHLRGVPPCPAPGVGTRLVTGLLEHELGGQVHVAYEPRGVRWCLRFSLAGAPVDEPVRA